MRGFATGVGANGDIGAAGADPALVYQYTTLERFYVWFVPASGSTAQEQRAVAYFEGAQAFEKAHAEQRAAHRRLIDRGR